jgi:hypothetical protein
MAGSVIANAVPCAYRSAEKAPIVPYPGATVSVPLIHIHLRYSALDQYLVIKFATKAQ